MKDFRQFTDGVVQYIENNQSVCLGASNNKWFSEFYQEPVRTEILQKYNESSGCSAKTAFKEMLDFQSSVERAVNVRRKCRQSFFVSNAIRAEGVKHRVSNKNQSLSGLLNHV